MLSAATGVLAAPAHRGDSEAVCYTQIDTSDDVAAAADLLRQAWLPPCLSYSDAYVGWQLGWAGPVRPLAIAATAGSRVVGLIAVAPRRIRISDRVTVVYVLSFFAVHPAYRGRHVGKELAERMLAASDRPTLTYTAPGAASGPVLAAAAVSRGWMARHLAEVRTYARAQGRGNQELPAVREATVEECLAAIQRCQTPGVAWSQPTVQDLGHYLADPRGSCLAVVPDSAGQVIGGALIVRSQVITARGVEQVPSLDAVFLNRTSAPALDALATFAQRRWSHDGMAVVTAPNLHVLEADTIRLSGFRATRSAFNLSVMGQEGDPVVREMAATNLEVF